MRVAQIATIDVSVARLVVQIATKDVFVARGVFLSQQTLTQHSEIHGLENTPKTTEKPSRRMNT